MVPAEGQALPPRHLQVSAAWVLCSDHSSWLRAQHRACPVVVRFKARARQRHAGWLVLWGRVATVLGCSSGKEALLSLLPLGHLAFWLWP